MRSRDATHLVDAVQRLDQLIAQAEVDDGLERWRVYFRDDLDVVFRARNNVRWGEFISDRNLAAAARIAERLVEVGEKTTTGEELA